MKIYGRTTSSNVMKVLWAATEIGLDYDRVDAGMSFGVVDTPEYRAMNPNGRVPTVVDDDLVLWESNAIVRYLAAKHAGAGLWLEDPGARADLDRWMDWQQTTFNPAMTPVFWGLVRTPAEKRDPAAIAAGVEQTNAALAILDARLEGRNWIGGDAITMADIPFGPNLHRYFNLDFAKADLPNVRRLYDNMLARPGYVEHISSIPIS